jgi:hypothetical protein
MAEYSVILEIENEITARLLESVLMEREIPHHMRSYHDSAYDGLFQLQKGWGQVIAPQAYEDEIKQVYADLKAGSDLVVGERA